jgi:hypothetical protein
MSQLALSLMGLLTLSFMGFVTFSLLGLETPSFIVHVNLSSKSHTEIM